MNLAAIRKLVEAKAPDIADVRIEATGNGDGLYFICSKAGMARCTFIQATVQAMFASIQKTDAAIASEIVKGLAE